MSYNIIRLNHPSAESFDRPVLVIYTGGTLGMVYDTKQGQLVPFEFKQVLDLVPEVRRMNFGISFLAFDEPIDSANMTPALWQELGKIIFDNYDDYDSFVILHGTDTMAYTASALSFMLKGLNKAVILTGAQLPIGIPRSDARENFITALEIATAKDEHAHPIISEVCIYFNSVLLRGNRAKKKESSDFNAFHSENYPVLAKAGVNIEYNFPYIKPFSNNSNLEFSSKLEKEVTFLKIFPGISREVVHSICNIEGLKGIVLETFGAGNVPTSEWFLAEIEAAVKRKLLIYNVSQCDGGRVLQGQYQSSLYLRDLGVLSGSDCTAEAAITKMMFVLGQTDDYTKQAEMLQMPLCGEMSI